MVPAVLKGCRADWLQKYTWPFTVLVAIGGLWFPKLGLLVIPVMLGLIVTSFFRGRYWCGNICAHGSLFDHVFGRISKKKAIPKFLKSPYLGWSIFVLFGYNITRRLVAVSRLWGTAQFWDRLGFVFVASYLMVLFVGGLGAILMRPRTWCTVCPMGTMQRISYRLGKWVGVANSTDRRIAISDPEKCRACGRCAKVCPMELSPYLGFSKSNQFEDENCIRCGRCAAACPFKLLSLVDVSPRGSDPEAA